MLNVKLIDCNVNSSTCQLTFVHHSLLQRLCYAFALEQRHKTVSIGDSIEVESAHGVTVKADMLFADADFANSPAASAAELR